MEEESNELINGYSMVKEKVTINLGYNLISSTQRWRLKETPN